MKKEIFGEDKLIDALRKSEASALEKLVSLYAERLLKSSYLICNHETDAHDLVQETFLQAILSIGRFKKKSRLYTWLYSIMLNVNRQRLRKESSLTYPGELPVTKNYESYIKRDVNLG